MTPPVVLTIAGSDSGGGAGIQADLKTFAALGVYGTSVITAITAQNTRGVTAIHPVPPEIVAAQLDAVLEDFQVAAVKVGMIGDPAVAEVIGARLAALPNLVVDPVLVSTSGARLATAASVAALVAYPCVLTPNRHEAGVLTATLAEAAGGLGGQEAGVLTGGLAETAEGLGGRKACVLTATLAETAVGLGRDEAEASDACLGEAVGALDASLRQAAGASDVWSDGAAGLAEAIAGMRRAAAWLGRCGPRAVVVTGSELAVDVLWHEGGTSILPGEPVRTANGHGSGCTFSSAIAARLALGDPVPEAVRTAKRYVTAALRGGSGWRLGAGPGPLHHFA